MLLTHQFVVTVGEQQQRVLDVFAAELGQQSALETLLGEADEAEAIEAPLHTGFEFDQIHICLCTGDAKCSFEMTASQGGGLPVWVGRLELFLVPLLVAFADDSVRAFLRHSSALCVSHSAVTSPSFRIREDCDSVMMIMMRSLASRRDSINSHFHRLTKSAQVHQQTQVFTRI